MSAKLEALVEKLPELIHAPLEPKIGFLES
jgi:hypothetical protein